MESERHKLQGALKERDERCAALKERTRSKTAVLDQVQRLPTHTQRSSQSLILVRSSCKRFSPLRQQLDVLLGLDQDDPPFLPSGL